MERDLVVCCDGTWNGPDVELVTNVSKLFNCLKQDDSQLCYYQPGVGTTANPLSWFFGGATGKGVRSDVINAYSWLAQHYRPGDRIWLFGFSRGAFTARSVAGMIGRCGILDGRQVDAGPKGTFYEEVEALFEKYRHGANGESLLSYTPNNHDPAFPIYFIGVWDTVGSLGIPDHLGFLNFLDAPHKYQFHNVRLDPRVRHARHCLAVDENRAPFRPALWEGDNDERMKQVWFPGSHVDVGGGYKEDGLSSGSLAWMIHEAAHVPNGLRFHQTLVQAVEKRANPLDTLHDDNRTALAALGPGFMLLKPVVDYIFSPRPRSAPALAERNRLSDRRPLGSVHPNVFLRQHGALPETGAYRPHVDLEPGSSHTVRVQAQREWNDTGLYLSPGTYALVASGEWRDAKEHWSGPEGEAWGALAHPLFSAVGVVERAVNALGARFPEVWRAHLPGVLRMVLRSRESGMVQAPWTRRVEKMPWMSLVGVVANGTIQGSRHIEHETFLIGDGQPRQLVVERPGYLYVFANQAWSAYQDNFGELKLTVRREGMPARPPAPEAHPMEPSTGDGAIASP